MTKLEIVLTAWTTFGLLCGLLAQLLPAGKAHDILQQIGNLAPKKPAPVDPSAAESK